MLANTFPVIRLRPRRGLTAADKVAVLYASIQSNGVEIAIRSRVVWGQKVILLGILHHGWLSMVTVYNVPQGGQPLFDGEIILPSNRRVAPHDNVTLTNIEWPS